MKGPLLLGLLAGAAGAYIARLRFHIRLLKKEISTMGLTAAQQKQIDDQLAANNETYLRYVVDAVTAETAEIRTDVQRIEAKVNEGTVTPADMQALLAKLAAAPANVKAAIETSIGGISANSGADSSEAGSGGGNGDNPNPDAP